MKPALRSCSITSTVRKNPLVKTTMKELYEQRHETGDIKFITASEEIPAHRCVLAALSPKYKAQFYGAMAQKDVINVTDVSTAAFKEFLQFFYTDQVTLTLENIEDVLNLAQQSLVDHFVDECKRFIVNAVGLDKLVWFYRMALRYDIAPLKRFCKKQINTNIETVFQTADFSSCDRAMLCHILTLNSLNCNEIDLFDACILWARAECQRGGIDDANTMNLRAVLGDALFLIRFCLISSEEFAFVGEEYSGLLSEEESMKIARAIELRTNGKTSDLFGEKSNSFGEKNTLPRQLYIISRIKERISFECILRTGPPMLYTSQNDNDCIEFVCDKPIELNGFVLCNQIVETIQVEIYVNKRQKDCNYTIHVLNDESKITFDNNPVRVRGNQLCRIVVKSEIFKESICTLCGFYVEQNVVQNGVSFRIQKETCNRVTTITQLLATIAIIDKR